MKLVVSAGGSAAGFGAEWPALLGLRAALRFGLGGARGRRDEMDVGGAVVAEKDVAARELLLHARLRGAG